MLQPTAVPKRLCSGYRPAVILVLVFWFLLAGLWVTVRISPFLNSDRRRRTWIPRDIESLEADSVPSFPQLTHKPFSPPTPLQADKSPKESIAEGCISCNKSLSQSPKSLISYVYNETPTNRRNLEFLIQHGLYKSADWVFSFNGETDADELLPNHKNSPWYDAQFTNIEVIKRENKCFDFGAHAEVMLREWSADGKKLNPMGSEDQGGRKFYEKYDRFILMNASIRGPFIPHWSRQCWSEAFWALMTEKTKLVGMSYNCHEGEGHLQSMIWATDRIGLGLLMQPAPIGIGYWCPINMVDAIYGEIRSTPVILNAGYEVDALVTVYHSHDGDDFDNDGKPDHRPDGYRTGCQDEDFFHENAYYGFNVHPYETIFMKSARQMQEALLGNLTEWVDGSGYSSYEMCDLIA